MLVAVVDTETTGIEDDARVVELASACIMVTDGRPGPVQSYSTSLVRPGVLIPPGAMAVHHITDSMVEEAPELQWAIAQQLLERMDVLVAHNAEFDSRMLPSLSHTPWICTMKCAMVVWPEAPSFGNQVLRYWLSLPVVFPEEAGQTPHRALYDAAVTAEIFLELMGRGLTVEQMVSISREPAQLPRMPFGKHRGLRWPEVPGDYLVWVSRQTDMDPAVVACARREIRRRQESRA